MTVTERAFNGLQACGYASKVNDIGDSITAVRKTYNDPKMSGTAKVAKCAAEGAFIVARGAEITHKVGDPRGKAVLNCYATATDVGRKIVDACITPEPTVQTIKKISLSIISGSAEFVTNLALATGNSGVAVLGTTVSVAIGLMRIFKIL